MVGGTHGPIPLVTPLRSSVFEAPAEGVREDTNLRGKVPHGPLRALLRLGQFPLRLGQFPLRLGQFPHDARQLVELRFRHELVVSLPETPAP